MNVCMIVNNLINNGIGKVVLNYSIELINHGHSVTLLVGGPIEENKASEAGEHRIAVVQLPDKKTGTVAYFKALRSLLQTCKYDLVHVHGNSGMILPELVIAKLSRVRVVACHCHSTGCEHPILHGLFRPFIPRLSDIKFACSREAGEWLYGQSGFVVLPNAFDLSLFAFDAAARSKIRSELGIDNHVFVLGNVARLNPEKNHAFLLKVFERLRKLDPSSVLIIAGGGPGESKIKALVESSPERDGIIMLGDVSNPAKLYSAMDCFVFPSIHEGLGIVLVEAQLSGLPCFVSDSVPHAASVSNCFYPIPLSSGADAWADVIYERSMVSQSRNVDSSVDSRINFFDIRSGYQILDDAYQGALTRKTRELS